MGKCMNFEQNNKTKNSILTRGFDFFFRMKKSTLAPKTFSSKTDRFKQRKIFVCRYGNEVDVFCIFGLHFSPIYFGGECYDGTVLYTNCPLMVWERGGGLINKCGGKKHLPSAVFRTPPFPNVLAVIGRFHPLQLLHKLSGSELHEHNESSSNRSESSKLWLSHSSAFHSGGASACCCPPAASAAFASAIRSHCWNSLLCFSFVFKISINLPMHETFAQRSIKTTKKKKHNKKLRFSKRIRNHFSLAQKLIFIATITKWTKIYFPNLLWWLCVVVQHKARHRHI